MARELLTSWGDFQSAIYRLLAASRREIQIYDHDLARLKLAFGPRLDHLKRLLQPRREGSIRITLRETFQLQHYSPRLMSLLADYSGCMSVLETPDQLAHLRDAMILADGRHGLILFDRNQPRSKLLLDEMAEIETYQRRFEDIWAEGGNPLSASTLGL